MSYRELSAWVMGLALLGRGVASTNIESRA